MEKVISLLDSSINELSKLEKEIKQLNDEELMRVAGAYPCNSFFHEIITQFTHWKKQIENK